MTDAASIDAWLPQTQCTRCGYPDCLAYAESIASGEADIDRCPPGGRATLRGLAELLGTTEPRSLAPDLEAFERYEVASIVESECIGCTKCIAACPVDAIVGSGKMMHTVVESLCTGCELCIPPCPVDCIRMSAPSRPGSTSDRWPAFPEGSDDRFRLARERRRRREAAARDADGQEPGPRDEEAMRQEILEAVARSRNRRQFHSSRHGSWNERK